MVIVEGEKCADALAGLTQEVGVLSWLGGSGAVLRTNWKALAKREVILWPDADDPGREAMARLTGELDRIGAAEVRVIDPEEDRPSGWDVADAIAEEGWGWEAVERYLLRAERVDEEESRRLRRVAEQVLVSAGEIEPGSDRLALGALSACRSRDPDGRGSRLRQELPEHGPGGVAVSADSLPFHRTPNRRRSGRRSFLSRTTRPGPSFPG